MPKRIDDCVKIPNAIPKNYRKCEMELINHPVCDKGAKSLLTSYRNEGFCLYLLLAFDLPFSADSLMVLFMDSNDKTMALAFRRCGLSLDIFGQRSGRTD